MLCDYNADVNFIDRSSGYALIHQAAIWDNVEILDILITNMGVDVNTRSIDGSTALLFACMHGNIASVSFIFVVAILYFLSFINVF